MVLRGFGAHLTGGLLPGCIQLLGDNRMEWLVHF